MAVFSCFGGMMLVLGMVLSVFNVAHAESAGDGAVIRVWGNPAMGTLMQLWQDAFVERHPEVRFEYDLRSTALAIPALTTGVADLVLLGRRPRVIEVSQFEFEKKRLPVVVEVAGGAYDVEGKSWPLVVYVHRDNPVRELSMQQLDFIFGAQRSGGWNAEGTQWLASAAREGSLNIRSWDELGLGGEWAGQRIVPYGYDIHSNSTAIAFGEMVFNGGDMWNEALQEIVAGPDSHQSAGERVTELLARDRFGIAIAGMQHANDDVRAVAVSGVFPTREAVMRREYPLARSVYVAFDDHPDHPQREVLREFIAFVLGEDGQGAIVREGEYLPLPKSIAHAEMEKVPLTTNAHAPYIAGRPVSGTIRTWGHFGMIGLMDAWKEGFRKYHPDVVFQDHLVNTALGMPGLATGVADIGLIGREPYRVELSAYQHYHGRLPFIMEFGTGAYLGSSFPPVIWVHRDNPVSQLTFSQLDGIFGAERNGGWHRDQMRWNPDAARGKERKISTWGELGLTGEWEHRPIQPFGFVTGPRSGVAQFLGMHVFQGSQKWTENLHEVWYEQQPDGRILDLNTVMVNKVASNPAAIGYGRPKAQTEMVKAVALARTQHGPFVQASEQTVANRHYPLARPVYMYANLEHDGALKPEVAEFMRYVLSIEGQQAIREEGSYRVLMPDVLAKQIERLERVRSPLVSEDARYLTAEGKIRVVGYNDMDEMLEALGQRFERQYPGIRFEWNLKGTRTAPGPLIEGTSAFAPMGAELEQDALARWRQVYPGEPLAVPIAHDSLTPGALSSPTGIFVHVDNPLRTISVDMLRRVVAPLPHEPRIRYWHELGIVGEQAHQPIRVIGLADDTAIGGLMLRRMQAGQYVDDFLAHRQSRDIATALANAPDALGIANLNHARPEIRALSIMDASGRETAADTEGIRSGNYPFDRHLLIYVRRDAEGHVEALAHAFLCQALSTQGQHIIAQGERGYLPLNSNEIADARRAIGGCAGTGHSHNRE